MILLQILIILFAVCAACRAYFRFQSGDIGTHALLGWLAFWTLASICVFWPGLTQKFANIVGVGRGADAVFYLGLIALSYSYFRLYLRLCRTEHQLTLLVRELALKQAERGNDNPH
jgi:hypothetical protein